MKLSSKNNELGTAALYCRLSRDDNMDTDYLSTMAYIYIVSECNYHFPPYGIIQHAIDDRLLEEYCLALQEELFAIIESDAG